MNDSPKYWWATSSTPATGLSPKPSWVRGWSALLYGLGQPLPWPRYTTTDAPVTAARTAGQVALGL